MFPFEKNTGETLAGFHIWYRIVSPLFYNSDPARKFGSWRIRIRNKGKINVKQIETCWLLLHQAWQDFTSLLSSNPVSVGPGPQHTSGEKYLTLWPAFVQTDDDIPQSFMQNFVLKPNGDSFFIQHDVFR